MRLINLQMRREHMKTILRYTLRLSVVATVWLLSALAALAQPIVRPAIYVPATRSSLLANNKQPRPASDDEGPANLDIAEPVDSQSQFGVSSRAYTLSVYGFPKCTTDPATQHETCVST